MIKKLSLSQIKQQFLSITINLSQLKSTMLKHQHKVLKSKDYIVSTRKDDMVSLGILTGGCDLKGPKCGVRGLRNEFTRTREDGEQ